MKKYIIFSMSLLLLIEILACTKVPEKESEITSSSESGKILSSPPTSQSGTPQSFPRRKRQRLGHAFGQRRWQPGTAVTLTDEEKTLFALETYPASYQTMEGTLQALGKVLAHPLRQAIVSYPFSGRIAEIHVRLGDWVKKGDPLVTLHSEAVGEARSAYYKALADYELAKVNYEREKNLFDKGVGAKKNLLSAEAQLKVAQSNLEAAEKKLHVLCFTEKQVAQMAKTHQINPSITLYAPIAGKIVTSRAVLGAMVPEETPIITILDPRLLCIDAELFEKDIAKVHLGQEVRVTVPAYPGQVFKGKIAYISDILNEETRTIKVRTEIPNQGLLLKPGMFANIEIVLNHKGEALVVPETAVLDDVNEQIVFVEKNGRYYPRVVKTGLRENGFVQILSGLEPGEKVVIKGSYSLKSRLYEDLLKKGHVH